MTFLYPIGLILIIPAALGLVFFKPRNRIIKTLRMIIAVLVLLSFCGFSMRFTSKAGTVIVIADRSSSMPVDSQTQQKEIVKMLIESRSGENTVGVVSFANEAVIEMQPQKGNFPGFISSVDKDGSKLNDAVRLANSLIPKNGTGRMLILSDGKWTGSDPVSISTGYNRMDVPIDYRFMGRSDAYDLAVYEIKAPDSINPGESFVISTWIQSPLNQEVNYSLLRNNTPIAAGKAIMNSGLNRLNFRDTGSSPGAVQYRLVIDPPKDDMIPENNTADFIVGIKGEKQILCLSNETNSGFAELLKKGGLAVDCRTPNNFNFLLADLANYSMMIVEDVPANKIGTAAMQNISSWVKHTGTGLMMTGGKTSFGPGGYFKSALEPIMPVSMELRREHRKLSVAIVVALDRSGSMTAPVSGGKTKMDLANIATAQVLDLLSPMDEFGVIAVDSSAHTIANLQNADNGSLRSKILSIESMGGGIFVYEALSNAAKMVSGATSETKHIILFADAADSEEPGDYKKLLEHCSQAGITVSVIGLGTMSDVDAPLLEDIAAKGQGRCFFTTSATELPQLFAQDTFVVARSTFVDEPTQIIKTAGLQTITGYNFKDIATIGGYNLCYLRDGANLAMYTNDEYNAPVVANWQAGMGRVLCYTGQVNGEYTGEMANWSQAGNLYASLVRWTAGQFEKLDDNMLLVQSLENGICRIELHLDPDRKKDPVSIPEVTVIQGNPGNEPTQIKRKMFWSDADMFLLEIPVNGTDVSLATVQVDQQTNITLSPVKVPYSPEFQPERNEDGKVTLQQIAKNNNGVERVVYKRRSKNVPHGGTKIYHRVSI